MDTLDVKSLSDGQLRTRLVDLALSERRITSKLLQHLAEYDRRRLYRTDDSGSLWNYCRKVLRFSESEINLRIQAARAVAKNEKLLGMLERGETTVTAIGRLAPHLQSDKAERLIEDVRGKSRREVEWIVAREKTAASIAANPAPATAPAQSGLFETSSETSVKTSAIEAATGHEMRLKADKIAPISGEEAEVRFLADRALVKKIERAQILLAGRCGDLNKVFHRVLDTFLDKNDPIRRQARRSLGTQPTMAKTRRVPRSLRDRVFARDGHRCTALEHDGRRCDEERWLEADHIVPAALGGPTSLDNLRTLCRRHNQAAAATCFGRDHIAAAVANRTSSRRGLKNKHFSVPIVS